MQVLFSNSKTITHCKHPWIKQIPQQKMTNEREKFRVSVPFVNRCKVNIVMPILKARGNGVRIKYSQNNQEFYRLFQKEAQKNERINS